MATFHKGSLFGLPDFGISERIQSAFQPNKALTPQGGSNLFNFAPSKANTGSTKGVQTGPVQGPPIPQGFGNQSSFGQLNQTSGGGRTSGQSGPQPSFNQDQYLETTPGFQSVDYDALIAPALDALSQAEGAAQGTFDADVGQIDTNLSGLKGREAQHIKGQESSAELQRGRQKTIAEEGKNQQRSALAEVRQGLQALYGGTTGTGAFATELAGRETMGNIGKIQTNLANAITEIDNRLNQVKETSKIVIEEAENEAVNLKDRAKAELQSSLAQIRNQKGELQMRKTELAFQAMQRYQETVQAVNARNAQFKQNIAQQMFAAEQKLHEARQRGETIAQQYQVDITNPNVVSQFSNLPPGFSVSGKAAIGNQPIAGGQFSYKAPEEEEEALF